MNSDEHGARVEIVDRLISKADQFVSEGKTEAARALVMFAKEINDENLEYSRTELLDSVRHDAS